MPGPWWVLHVVSLSLLGNNSKDALRSNFISNFHMFKTQSHFHRSGVINSIMSCLHPSFQKQTFYIVTFGENWFVNQSLSRFISEHLWYNPQHTILHNVFFLYIVFLAFIFFIQILLVLLSRTPFKTQEFTNLIKYL